MPELLDLHLADDGVATITLRHGKVNALCVALLNELRDAARSITSGEVAARAVVIGGGPKLFAAGADITEFASDPDPASFAVAGPERVREIGGAFLDALNAVAAIPVPTIASVSGFALGGGCELALACDLRIAAHEARIGLPEAGLGLLAAAGGTQRLTRLVGPGLARRLILGAETLDGASAERLGLVQWALPRAELEDGARALADRLAATPRHALAAAKRCIGAALDGTRDGYAEELEHTRALYADPRTQALVAAFAARSAR